MNALNSKSITVLLSLLAIARASFGQPNTLPNKVVITPEQVLSINGRKVFPIGFTVPPPPDAKTPSGKLALEEFREAGATFIRTGPMRDIEEEKNMPLGTRSGPSAKNST